MNYSGILLRLNYVFIVALGLASWFIVIPAEDAVILYEYSKNLASDGLITYGGATTPIEGATDFLWMIIISILKLLSIDEFFSSLILSLTALILVSYVFGKETTRPLFLIFWLLTPFLYAGLQGFSVVFFTSWYLFTIHLFFKKNKYLYFSVLILCLIRPDGVVFGAGIVALTLVQSSSKVDLMIEVKRCVGQLVAPGLVYFFSRAVYFEELFPLPFYVKTGGTDGKLFFFYISSALVIIKALIPIISCVISDRIKKNQVLTILAILILPVIFYSMVRLEQNVGNRFMAPLAFSSFYLIAKFYRTRTLLLFSFLWIIISFEDTVATVNWVFSSKIENIYKLSIDLDDLQGKMLVTEAGRLAYYNNWFVHDAWGLNTPRFSRQLIDPHTINRENYDLIVAHCPLDLLQQSADLLNGNNKTWQNMCKNIVRGINDGNYEIYLVPFRNGSSLLSNIRSLLKKPNLSKCPRHDIYAISNTYDKKGELKNKLIKFNGVLYSPNLSFGGNDRVCRAFH